MTMNIQIIFCVILLLTLGHTQNWSGDVADRCFCKLQGEVDDCSCKVETLDSLNNNKIYPRLKSLLARNYFRYFKVNLKKPCPYWSDDSRCALKDCHVKVCPKEEIPFKVDLDKYDYEAAHEKNKYIQKSNKDAPNFEESCAEERKLSALDTTISDEKMAEFQTWKEHDETLPMFCDIDDEHSNDLEYVDLLLNPERYTGYKGPSPHRIWRSIYEENCFKPEKTFGYGPDMAKSFGSDAPVEYCHIFGCNNTERQILVCLKTVDFPSLQIKNIFILIVFDLAATEEDFPPNKLWYDVHDKSMCLEKRAFYRLISGLHTSINIHLCDKYLFPAKTAFGSGTWDHNLEEFQSRFDPKLTNGQGPQRLKNLYFTYLVELRALSKAVPYLTQEFFYTGDQAEDVDMKEGILNLLDVIKSFPDHFDESQLFRGNTKEMKKLKSEFVLHFHNVSRIMDCVGCDKCKLWGKLQILGMGTALKILFSGDSMSPGSTVKTSSKDFQLTRTEIVALFNAFGRLSSSIHAIETFRKLAGKPGDHVYK